MLSRTKIGAGLAGVASMFLIAGTSLSAVSASAADPDVPVACTVSGVANVNGLTVAGGPTTGGFTGTTINCVPPSPVSDDGGLWTGVSATFGSSSENCAAGSGAGDFTGGSGGDGTVTGGHFTFTRAGTAVVVTGEIKTSGNWPATPPTETHHFVAHLQFAPSSGPCVGGSGSTSASLNGVAVIDSETNP